MKISLLRATAFVLLQAFAVHSSEDAAASSEQAIKNVAAGAAAQVLASTSSLNLGNSVKSKKNRSGSSGSSSSYSKPRNKSATNKGVFSKLPNGGHGRSNHSDRSDSAIPSSGKSEKDRSGSSRLTLSKSKKEKHRSGSSKTEKHHSSSSSSSSSDSTSSKDDDDANRRPTKECEDLGESAAEFIVFDNVCTPNYGQQNQTPEFDRSCRYVAYGVCDGQISVKIQMYCPDENINSDELERLQDLCNDEVDSLTGGFFPAVE